MSAWIVYDKNGLAKCEARKLEYQGEFMGSCSVNVTITSPTPIGFELGDWLEYRGERFELNYDPSVVKEASSDSYGEGFVYESIVFNSLSDELTRCDFLDYVPSDNEIHYSSLPTFSFFADSIGKLAERIQVNLDRIYTGDKKWTVEVHEEYVNTLNVNITASNNTVWDALGFVNSKFGANFIIRGRTITIGTTGLAVGQLFSYGKGNGLYKIERNAESNQKVITRLRAYGSTRNMPTDYYNNVEGGNVPNNMAVKNLMLPSFPTETHDPYIDSPNIEELGIREGTVFFDGSNDLEEIYPTMEGKTSATQGALDEVLSAEQIADDGKVPDEGEIQKTFTITLKEIGFNINDYLTGDTATISMTSGMCGGREFEIVKCEKVDSGYKLTCNRAEDSDLGLYFPYNDYQITGGDKFVLLNIEMPDEYIEEASQKLLKAAEAYLAKNDYVRYSYTLEVDNIFMARQHDEAMASGGVSLHDTIKEGDLMLFEDEDLGINGGVTIASLTIKEYADGSLVPEYGITLQDEKTVGTIEKIQNQLDSLSAYGGSGASVNTEQVTSIIKAIGKTLFLSKKQDDRSRGMVASDKGFEVGRFQQGELGSGGVLKVDENGDSYLEVDKALFRKRAEFVEIMVKKLQHVGGTIILSPASMKCAKVEEMTSYYRCYFLAEHEGAAINQEFVVGDQARSQKFNINEGLSQNVGTQYYWRLVAGVSNSPVEIDEQKYHYIDLSVADCDSGSGVPQPGDDIVQLGNRDNTERQNAIVLSSFGTNTPSFRQYASIKTYSLSDARLVTEFSPDGNLVTGDFVSKNGKNLSDWLEELEVDWDKVLEQTDKQFTMWFYEYDPSAYVYPESEWTTDELKALHEQDLFYNTESGKAWRYVLVDGVYSWIVVTDSDTIKALAEAAKANDRIENIVSDGVLSALEKKEVRKEWDALVETYKSNVSLLEVYSLGSILSAYNEAFNELSKYLNNGEEWSEDSGYPSMIAGSDDSEITPSDYRKVWSNYYGVETQVRNHVSVDNKDNADSKIRNFITNKDELPPPPYNVGDRWCKAEYTDENGIVRADNDDLVCVTAKEKGDTPAFSDWDFVSQATSAKLKVLSDEIVAEVEAREALSNDVSSLRLSVDGIDAMVSEIKFDSSGNITNINTSGLVLSSNFASLFSTEVNSQGIAKTAEIEAYVDNGISNIKLTADNVSINGIVNVGENSVSIGGFTINGSALQAGISTSDGIMTLSKGYLGYKSDDMHVLIGPDSLSAAGGVAIYSKVDSGMVSLFSVGGCNLVAPYYLDKVLIGGLALTYKNGDSFTDPKNTPSGTSGVWVDFLVTSGNVVLPSAASCPGKVLFVRCTSESHKITSSSTIYSGSSGQVTDGSLGRIGSFFFISNGTNWYTFCCYYSS